MTQAFTTTATRSSRRRHEPAGKNIYIHMQYECLLFQVAEEVITFNVYLWQGSNDIGPFIDNLLPVTTLTDNVNTVRWFKIPSMTIISDGERRERERKKQIR